jgi:hypothetical protein
VNGQIYDEFMSTGAVVAGRGTFEPAGGWGGDHHDGVPIFVVARHKPGIDISRWPLVSYVDDVAAMTRAKEAAGDKNVLVHGAGVTRLALAAASLPSRSSCSPPASSRARMVSATCITASSSEPSAPPSVRRELAE